jgi:hypothetical protein
MLTKEASNRNEEMLLVKATPTAEKKEDKGYKGIAK